MDLLETIVEERERVCVEPTYGPVSEGDASSFQARQHRDDEMWGPMPEKDLGRYNGIDDLLSADAFGALAGVTPESLVSRERAGELFAVRSGNTPYRLYPACLALPNVGGRPLARIMEALGPDRVHALTFLEARSAVLANLRPLEVLVGEAIGDPTTSNVQDRVLGLSVDERLAWVLTATRHFRQR